MPLAKAANLFTEDNENENIISTAYLCDTREDGPWDKYRDIDEKAVWAMGGATAELFEKSFSAYQDSLGYTYERVTFSVTGDGYKTNEFYGHADVLGGAKEYANGIYHLRTGNDAIWYLASPSDVSTSMCCVSDHLGDVTNFAVFSSAMGYAGLRPIVCIPKVNFDGFELQ